MSRGNWDICKVRITDRKKKEGEEGVNKEGTSGGKNGRRNRVEKEWREEGRKELRKGWRKEGLAKAYHSESKQEKFKTIWNVWMKYKESNTNESKEKIK